LTREKQEIRSIILLRGEHEIGVYRGEEKEVRREKTKDRKAIKAPGHLHRGSRCLVVDTPYANGAERQS
jgi:hypothetical protein